MTDAAVPTGRRKRDRKPTLDFADPAGQPLMTGAESVVSFETLMNELESAPPLESTRSPVRAHAPRPYYAYGMVCSPIGRADRSGERRESAPSRHLRKLGAHLSGPPARVQSLPRSSSFLDRRSRLLVRIVSTLLIFAALCGVALALAVSVRILALDHREHNVDVKRSAQVGPGGAPRSTVARLHRTHLLAVRSGAGLTGLAGLRLRSKGVAEALPPLTTERSWTTPRDGARPPAQELTANDALEPAGEGSVAWEPPRHGALRAHFLHESARGTRLLIGSPTDDDGVAADDWRIEQ
jgi:hypothetical protein